MRNAFKAYGLCQDVFVSVCRISIKVSIVATLILASRDPERDFKV